MKSIFSRFVKLWVHPEYPPFPATKKQMDMAESILNTHFPNDYKDALLNVGSLGTTNRLLDKIVDGEHDIHDLTELFTLDQVVSETVDWHEIGLPRNLIAIGSDALGNKFCIGVSQNIETVKSTIYFWDHDFDEVEEVASSFDEWIKNYNSLAD